MPIVKPPPISEVQKRSSGKQNFWSQLSNAQLPRSNYDYSPLRGNQIRLLRLHAAESSTDTIVCSLDVFDFDQLEGPTHDALSYTWGNDEATQKISIQIPVPSLPTDAKSRWQAAKQHTQEQRDKRRLYIRPNLEDALRQFRDTDSSQEDLFLWVDALCINQDDETEKSRQVAKMAEIYSKARDVLIWLGKEYNGSSTAIDFVPKILDLEQSEALISKESNRKQWTALADLLKREWFSRRWVVQELALCKSRYVYCGNRSLNWGDLERAITFFSKKIDNILALFTSSADAKILGDFPALGAIAMVNITSYLFRWDEDNLERMSSLENLVDSLIMFESRDPRDTIYALLSIASDTRSWNTFSARGQGTPQNPSLPPIEADYSKNILEVFKDFTAFCIQTSGSLDIMCRHWAPSQFRKPALLQRVKIDEEQNIPHADSRASDTTNAEIFSQMIKVRLPSWIGLLSDSPYGVSEGGPKARRAGESIVGPPKADTNIRAPFNASLNTRPSVLFGEVDALPNQDPNKVLFQNDLPKYGRSKYRALASETLENGRKRQSDGTIYVRGFKIDEIDQVSHRLFEGMVPAEWLQHAGWNKLGSDGSTEVPVQLWKTLVADRDHDGHKASNLYQTALDIALTKCNTNGDLITADLIRQGRPEDMVTFLQRAQNVLWNRKFFLLKRAQKPRFGLGPTQTQEGDIVCIFLGCSVPVVLRKVGTWENPAFQFIGEAFMHGLMEGQALNDYRNLDHQSVVEKSMEFRLV